MTIQPPHPSCAIHSLSCRACIQGTRSQLKMRFSQSIQRSQLEEIHRQKINRVMELLRDTHDTVIDIASSCGFSGPEHLIRLFKRKTGQTPLTYRQQEQKWN